MFPVFRISRRSRIARAAAVVLAGSLAAAGAFAADTATTIRLVERATSDAVLDLGPKDDSLGDLLTFANDVYDAANQKKTGTDQGYCVRVAKGVSWECFWTLTLADGQITVEGPFFDKSDSVLAITGGTGAYRSARGEMKLHARNAEGSEYDFAYEIVK